MRVIDSKSKDFPAFFATIQGRGGAQDPAIASTVSDILDDVKTNGDAALIEYTERFDGVKLKKSEIRVRAGEIKAALKAIPARDLEILKLAAQRIEAFHRHQLQSSWFFVDELGATLGQKITAIERVGIYVPGAKAAYPSTVLMAAVPARVAGVERVCMVTPPCKKGISPYVLAAAGIAGVDAVFRVGGAQAVGALAFGTKTIPAVDKIVGPGNAYVAAAKRLVFGTVDIDMIAGPSEILIINDGTGEPAWIAVDLLSQAEHDELASAVLITTSRRMARAVSKEVRSRLKGLKRRKIAEESIKRYGGAIVAQSLNEAVEISNLIAPEHLELFVENPLKLMERVKNAGAVFLGTFTPEALGDYIAGPNHTLPTGGTARFFSPLGVEDFRKKTNVVGFPEEAVVKLGGAVQRFAKVEGLNAHAESVRIRLGKKKN